MIPLIATTNVIKIEQISPPYASCNDSPYENRQQAASRCDGLTYCRLIQHPILCPRLAPYDLHTADISTTWWWKYRQYGGTDL